MYIISRYVKYFNHTRPNRTKLNPHVFRWPCFLEHTVLYVWVEWMQLAPSSTASAAGIAEGLTWLYFCDSGSKGRMMCLQSACSRRSLLKHLVSFCQSLKLLSWHASIRVRPRNGWGKQHVHVCTFLSVQVPPLTVSHVFTFPIEPERCFNVSILPHWCLQSKPPC